MEWFVSFHFFSVLVYFTRFLVLVTGHADSTDAPIPTIDMLLAADVKDPMLKSIQETLSKQFNDLILFREKVLQLKKNVTEQEKAIEVRTRKLAKDESKAERKKTLSTAVEMAFERRCAHDDRIGMRAVV